jgi:hypothetical protein
MHPKIPNSMIEFNDERTGSKASISSPLFSVGDHVTAAASIYDGPTEEMPAQDYCRKGDTLEIRGYSIRGGFIVAHLDREPGAGFRVSADEILPLNDQAHATGPAGEMS